MKTNASIFIVLIGFLLLVGCIDKKTDNQEVTSPIDANQNNDDWTPPKLILSPVFPELSFNLPVGLYQSKQQQWFVVEQTGKIKTFNEQDQQSAIFLDITDRANYRGEMGLLGMALDPEFDNNGRFFVSYNNHDSQSIISIFQSSQYVAASDTEKNVMTVDQPYSNHNGGQISFGNDGFLYIGLGDGGSGGDPKNNGQNTNTLLGAILRIDVNHETLPYGIPEDNPFVNSDGLDEIYAYGLRNPWRWSFDKQTGELWLADVGQNQWEEINMIKPGGNYGWNVMEGFHCYQTENCQQTPYLSPIFEYSHNEGQSVTGGYVYRGQTITALQGVYVYGDFVSGQIWGLRKTANQNYQNFLLFDTELAISSFAEDQAGNIYVIDYQSGRINMITEQ